jgi:hypothetical protein
MGWEGVWILGWRNGCIQWIAKDLVTGLLKAHHHSLGRILVHHRNWLQFD